MIVRLVAFEGNPTDPEGERSWCLWSGELVRERHAASDFRVELPADFHVGVLTRDKRMRLEIELT